MAQYGRLEMNYIETKCSETERGEKELSELQNAQKISGSTNSIGSIYILKQLI